MDLENQLTSGTLNIPSYLLGKPIAEVQRELGLSEVVELALDEGGSYIKHLNSCNLCEIEQQIAENIQRSVTAKLFVCIGLARIKMRELYREAGLASFKDYVRTSRISLHYHTVHDYAKIGETFLKYRDKLDSVDFKEDCGLKKLLLLEDALKKYRDDHNLVFLRLRTDSYRNFRRLVAGADESARADYRCPHLSIAEECIVIMPEGKELLWFEPEMANWFESPKHYARFKHHICRAAQEFLVKNPGVLSIFDGPAKSQV